MTVPDAVVRLDHVAVQLGAVTAVADVSLRVEAGSIVALIGPSGSGKSTLLRLMVGLERPSSGSVVVDDVDPTGPDHVALQRRIGYVIQDGGLFPHLTARDNVLLLARHIGRAEADMRPRVDELAALVQLPLASLDRYPAQLSGGQRQRIALMRALMLDPDVLLLDEPFGALDPIVRAELRDQLKSIFAKLEKTVVLVTHDLAEAAFFASRLVLLNAGAVVADGSIASLVASADPFVAQFVSAHRSLLA